MSNFATAIALIPHDAAGTQARTTELARFTARKLHQLLKHHGFMAFSDRKLEGDGQPIAVTTQMNFGTKAEWH